MFRTLLIANRGEIAVRVARACRDLGVRSVGVYSDADRDAPYLDYTDEAYALGGRAAAESYLDVAKIVAVARRAGADALHPGYGFLAESPRLAEACEEAGIAFVGPSPEAIRLMGSKAEARRIAREASLPLAPGTEPLADPREARAFAAAYGYPVAIKAVAGGGGRGMRVARSEGELEAAFEGAAREGAAYFGDGAVYAESFLDDPKHIEVQLVGLPSGEALTLGERDCSVQRRRQKLVEEAPGPTVTPALRADLERSAAALAERVGYRGAGTVEFLLAPGGAFYFLEMNTRIQVEHPVTELVYGCDLVAMQLLVAAGEDPPPPAPPLGHAIECRINAESVRDGFRPATGTISRLREPAGPGVRVDSGVREGYAVPPEYDSLLAKLVTWGETREAARARMLRALSEYEIGGLPTTLPAHRWILDHPAWTAGSAGTTFLERALPELVASLPPVDPSADLASGTAPAVPPVPREATVEVDGRRFRVAVYGPVGGAPAVPAPSRSKPPLPGASTTGTALSDALRSPIGGNVVRVAVVEGQRVDAGELACVVEAMKMENEIGAHKTGTVRRVHVEAGRAVAADDTLVEIGE